MGARCGQNIPCVNDLVGRRIERYYSRVCRVFVLAGASDMRNEREKKKNNRVPMYGSARRGSFRLDVQRFIAPSGAIKCHCII